MPVGAVCVLSGRQAMRHKPSDPHPLVDVLAQVDSGSCPHQLNFHCHSLWSDGSLSAVAIADQAVELGLQHFAVTDHHSIGAHGGVAARLQQLQQQGMTVPTLWTGTEISCVLETCLVHVLALGYEPDDTAIQPYLQGDTVIGDHLEAAEVVKAIHAANGLAVLAHPARYRISFIPLMRSAAALGFDGAECWYDYEMLPSWRPSPLICERVAALADELNLLQTCGTDSHGFSLKGR